MKKFSITLAAVLFVALAIAQPPKGKDFQGPKGPDMEKMQIVLELTDEQVAQWNSLHETHKAEQIEARELMRKEREAHMQKMKAEREEIMEAHQNELKKILSPEQFKKFEAIRPEHPGPNGTPGQGNSQKGDQNKQFNRNDCYKTGPQNKGK